MKSLSNRANMPKSPRSSASMRCITSRPISVCNAAADSKPMWSGKNVAPPKKGKHFLHLDDFTKDELQDMLAQGAMAKKKFYARDESFKPFAGQSMAMIFTKPSARTRVSFETGFFRLGGHAIYLDPNTIQLGKREPTKDIARVLSGYNDVSDPRSPFALNRCRECSSLNSPLTTSLNNLTISSQ